jgi:tubulin polyglutamylase TTLL1
VVSSRAEVEALVEREGGARRDADCGGWIAQKYIENPLLVRGRKFDVRFFVLLVPQPAEGRSRRGGGGAGGGASAVPAPPRAYAYRDAYVRTSGERFSLDPAQLKNRLMHLTNDGVQKGTATYGKYEAGNKLSLEELEACVQADVAGAPADWVNTTLVPRMKSIVAASIAACADAINPNANRRCFELLGYDFMVDEQLNTWFIEVNSNPCLELSSPYLERFLPELISNVMRVGLDPLFPPPPPHERTARQDTAYQALMKLENRFDLVFDPADPPPLDV